MLGGKSMHTRKGTNKLKECYKKQRSPVHNSRSRKEPVAWLRPSLRATGLRREPSSVTFKKIELNQISAKLI